MNVKIYGQSTTWIINSICQGKHYYCSYWKCINTIFCMTLNIACLFWFVYLRASWCMCRFCDSGSYRMVVCPRILDCWSRWQSFGTRAVLHISPPSWSTSMKTLWRPTTPAMTSVRHSTRPWRWAVTSHIPKTRAVFTCACKLACCEVTILCV